VTSYLKVGPGKCDEEKGRVNFSLKSRDVIYGRPLASICVQFVRSTVRRAGRLDLDCVMPGCASQDTDATPDRPAKVRSTTSFIPTADSLLFTGVIAFLKQTNTIVLRTQF